MYATHVKPFYYPWDKLDGLTGILELAVNNSRLFEKEHSKTPLHKHSTPNMHRISMGEAAFPKEGRKEHLFDRKQLAKKYISNVS